MLLKMLFLQYKETLKVLIEAPKQHVEGNMLDVREAKYEQYFVMFDDFFPNGIK